MNATPEIRAVTKLVMFALTLLVTVALTLLLLEFYGMAMVLQVLGVALLVFTLKMFYDIQVAEERYKDKLKELQNTIRGE
jgi:membrane protein YdbS with pleckstrin-like domain